MRLDVFERVGIRGLQEMNCEKCQDLLSDYLDGALDNAEHAMVSAHLDSCAYCEAAREEFLLIIGAAYESREHLYAPPNEYALWRRIRDSVEAEREAAFAGSFWSRFVHRRLQFTLPQLATAGAALTVAVAFGTTVGMQYLKPADSTRTQSNVTVSEDPGYPRQYLQPNQATLKYWEQRVELRKASWNPRMRASFDRSLSALNSAVDESLRDLQQNPHDEVAEEMLNSALRDRMDLLREFGEQ